MDIAKANTADAAVAADNYYYQLFCCRTFVVVVVETIRIVDGGAYFE